MRSMAVKLEESDFLNIFFYLVKLFERENNGLMKMADLGIVTYCLLSFFPLYMHLCFRHKAPKLVHWCVDMCVFIHKLDSTEMERKLQIEQSVNLISQGVTAVNIYCLWISIFII